MAGRDRDLYLLKKKVDVRDSKGDPPLRPHRATQVSAPSKLDCPDSVFSRRLETPQNAMTALHQADEAGSAKTSHRRNQWVPSFRGRVMAHHPRRTGRVLTTILVVPAFDRQHLMNVLLVARYADGDISELLQGPATANAGCDMVMASTRLICRRHVEDGILGMPERVDLALPVLACVEDRRDGLELDCGTSD